ncbi:MAG: sugar phosphate isomerase/epimerase [Thermomicrobiales bacterium]|nr:sugar phosphate isomerase/epimerase [Thermomicrobiales bacterium]
MKLSFATLVGLDPLPIDEVVAWAVSAGFDGLEVNTGPGYPVVAGNSYPGHLDLQSILADGPDSTLALFERSGVELFALAPMLNLLTRDNPLQRRRIAEMRLTIKAAAALGCPTVVTFAGSADGMTFYGLPGVGDDHPSNRVRDNLDRFEAIYGPLAELADGLGVRIAFETAGRGGGEGNIAHNPELWDAMFEAVPSTAIGLSFDPSHLIWLRIPDIPGLIRQYGDRIYHVDGKDCEILPDRLARQGILGSGWWRYRLPGYGAVDWPAVLAALHEIGYDGPITIEQEDPLLPGYEGMQLAGEYLRGLTLSSGPSWARM